MIGVLGLAWKYVIFHKIKSAILVASIFMAAILPVTVKILLWQFDQKIVARADSTPAVVGPIGSSLDLTLNAIYFKSNDAGTIPYSHVATLRDRNLAEVIPIHAMFTARGFSTVGTSLEYFDFRDLRLQSGSMFATLGDCVLGSQVAKSLNLGVGDHLITDRDNWLNIAGQAPLNLSVAGVLQESKTPDDWAVFVDLKTAWVIQGLGHGHQDLNQEDKDSPKLLSRTDKKIVANAAVVSYLEITPENIESFHFHGETGSFPITAIIVVAPSVKNETLLQGDYASGDIQFARPGEVIRKLMAMVFRINQFFDANAILIALSTALLLVLVIMLSLRLRQREMETMFKLGCSRRTVVSLQIAEMGIIFGVAIVLLALAIWGVWLFSGDLVESLMVNSR